MRMDEGELRRLFESLRRHLDEFCDPAFDDPQAIAAWLEAVPNDEWASFSSQAMEILAEEGEQDGSIWPSDGPGLSLPTTTNMKLELLAYERVRRQRWTS